LSWARLAKARLEKSFGVSNHFLSIHF
jgi:hypothetical protein